MAKPATRQRMLRQILVAVLDAPAPQEIRFIDPDQDYETGIVALRADSVSDAREIATALRLRNRRDGGQPHPLTTTPEHWSGTVSGDLFGWRVQIDFKAPFTGEFVDQWEATGGFRIHGTPRPEPVTT